MDTLKPFMLGYQLIAVIGILEVGLYASELLEGRKKEPVVWLIARLTLAIFLYGLIILSLTPLWAFMSKWRTPGCGPSMRRLASVPSVILLAALVALIGIDLASFLVKQQDRALFGAFHVLSILSAICQFIFLQLRERREMEEHGQRSRVCDLLVVSIVCINSALAIVDVVGAAHGDVALLEKQLPAVVPLATLVLPLVVEFHRNIASHWLTFNFEHGSHMRCEEACFPGEGVPLLMVAVLMVVGMAFMPSTVRYLFALSSVLVASTVFYVIFVLWHWEPVRIGHDRLRTGHWVVIAFDRVLLGITSTVTSVVFIVLLCTQAENAMIIVTLVIVLFTHIMQTFFVIWLMDVKEIHSTWTPLGRFCQVLMILYNLYAFLLYAFYANHAYESASAAGKVVAVVSFFVAMSFCDLAIHWSEFKFVRLGATIEEDRFVYEPVVEEEVQRRGEPRLARVVGAQAE